VTGAVLATLQQWVLLSGVAVAVGCIAWRFVVAQRAWLALGDAARPAIRRIEHRVASVGLVTSLVLIASWLLRMVVQVMGFRDPFVPLWEDVSFLLFETFWGTVWMAQGVTLALLALAFWRTRPRPTDSNVATTRADETPFPVSVAWWAAAGLVAALVSTLALSSHAMGVDSWRPFFVTADAVHALAAGTWIGTLAIILIVGRPAGHATDDVGLFAAQLRGFSPLAIVSVFGLVAMGIVLSWTHLSSVTDLWTVSYGRVLSAKIGAAVLVFSAGLWNWRRGLTTSDTPEGAARVRTLAGWEVSLAAGVLLLTAVLVHTPKP
jgi:copper transport protein